MSKEPVWPDKIETSLAPGFVLVPCEDPIRVRGKLWRSYVPEQEAEETVIVERCEDGRLIRTH